MKRLNVFIFAILAGISIAIGGVAFLSIESKVVGALVFSLGLFTVLTHGLNLFTGKVAYAFEKDKDFNLNLPIIWVGNLIGACAVGGVIQATRLTSVLERAATVSAAKLDDSMLSLFILGIFCNILIYIAVDGYNNNPHEFGKYLAIVFGVVGFIVCGFEHCVADMFYFTAGSAWSADAFLRIIVITLGNCVGGWILPLCKMFRAKAEKS